MKNLHILLSIFFLVFQNLYCQVGIGTASPNTNAILEVNSSNQGVKFPRLTSSQRTAISSPAKGLTVFDINLDCLMVNFGTPSSPSWKCLGGLHIIGDTDFGTIIRGINSNASFAN